ncbi:MAG: hypothetical protein JWO91_864 [Acidobacteriaceae bacterium]|nr:hypothetical protein [Acidobacteriaceae bacterium]
MLNCPVIREPCYAAAMPVKQRIAIIGAGRLGTALVRELARANYKITEVVSRGKAASKRQARRLAERVGARAVTMKTAHLDADVIWICVPDSEISGVARDIAGVSPFTIQKRSAKKPWRYKAVFHSSGALTSDELDVLRQQGGAVASIHPLMTFVSGSVPSLKGIPFGIEGDARAVREAMRIVRQLGGEAFNVRKENKAAYHAWGTFLSPLLLAFLVTAENVAQHAGVSATDARKKMLPIVKQTLANYAVLGPAQAFSGPIVRGDIGTVRQHLRVLNKILGASDVYIALAKSATLHLPVQNRRELKSLLSE